MNQKNNCSLLEILVLCSTFQTNGRKNVGLKIGFLFSRTLLTTRVFFILEKTFFNFSCMFLNPNNFSNLNSNCSTFLDLRNLQEQVEKAFCYQKLIWPFTVWTHCSSDLNFFLQTLDLQSRISKVLINH